MILGRFILQGNSKLHGMRVDEQEGCSQINNRVLSTNAKGSWVPDSLIHSLQPQRWLDGMTSTN
jgi:hypothetical protein